MGELYLASQGAALRVSRWIQRWSRRTHHPQGPRVSRGHPLQAVTWCRAPLTFRPGAHLRSLPSLNTSEPGLFFNVRGALAPGLVSELVDEGACVPRCGYDSVRDVDPQGRCWLVGRGAPSQARLCEEVRGECRRWSPASRPVKSWGHRRCQYCSDRRGSVLPPAGVCFAAAIPELGWARVAEGRRFLSQVILGTVLGAVGGVSYALYTMH